ncbi:MAG: ABC transporter permease, partial [Armatimonadetes bacterium]|nr:ABC transporter permease [Armatimonadota bacterium]
RELFTSAKRVVPVCRVFAELRQDGQTIPAKTFGTTPGYATVNRVELAAGRFLDETDIERRARVCVIGSDVKRNAFFLEDPVGKPLRINNQDFQVIGVMEERTIRTGGSMFSLPTLNEDIYLPITVAMEDFQIYVEQAIPMDTSGFFKILARLIDRPALEKRPVTQIIVQVEDESQTWEAARVTQRILSRRHKEIPDFETIIPAELLRQSQQTQRIFNIVMGAIASISLLVGGIGIMNIMLATVTQRAREIGIRRCIGASRSDIARQFLLEALVITAFGGLLGIVLGVEMATLISEFAGWRTIVSGQAILVSLGVAIVTGVVFGLYPAMRAASIQPMEALRAE